LLEFRGMKFAYDVQAMRFIRVDSLGWACLEELATADGIEEARKALRERLPDRPVDEALDQLCELRRGGLLRGPVVTYDRRDYEAHIQRLLRMSTGNIELYLAESCNLRCKYCYVAENDALRSGLMPEEVALAAVDLVFRRANGVRNMQITFFGGEPLLNKPVMKSVIRYSQERAKAEDKVVRYSLTTNATLLDDEVIELIRRHNFGLMISMDGPPEVHDAMRPMVDGSGSFELAARNVKRLMRRRRSVTARRTVTRNCLDTERISQYLEDFGFTRVGLSYCYGTSTKLGPHDIHPEDRATLDSAYDRQAERWLDTIKRGETPASDPFTRVLRTVHSGELRPAPMLQCGVCRGCTTVGVDGSLYPCHRYMGMEPFVVGDVWSGVSDQKHAAYLRGYFATKEKCRSCWAVNWCGGMCPWYVSAGDGSFVPPPDHRCDAIKRFALRCAWLYERVREECPEYVARLDPPCPGDDDAPGGGVPSRIDAAPAAGLEDE